MNSLSWPIRKKPQVYAFVVIEAPDSNGARIVRETEEEPVSSRPESRRTTSYSSSFFFVSVFASLSGS